MPRRPIGSISLFCLNYLENFMLFFYVFKGMSEFERSATRYFR